MNESQNIKKKVFLVEPRGFCFGVKNALKIVDDVLDKYRDRKIWVFNEIVHNKTIVNDLKSKGISFTQNAEEIPDQSVVIISAHGISPNIYSKLKERNLTVIDATCPLVQKVHQEVVEYSEKGYHIIYIGNKSHDEARGVIDEQPDNISVISSEKDIPSIRHGFSKYIVLNQTTLNIYDVEKLIEKIRGFYPNVEFPPKDDICFATASRQKAVLEMGKKCDLTIVIGSQNSSNSQKLKQIVLDQGGKAVLIDSFQELSSLDIESISSICITAGASAPEHLVTQTVDFLVERYSFSLEK